MIISWTFIRILPAEPQKRRTAEPQNRRTAEPQNPRLLGFKPRHWVSGFRAQNRRTAEPQNRRTPEPQNRRTPGFWVSNPDLGFLSFNPGVSNPGPLQLNFENSDPKATHLHRLTTPILVIKKRWPQATFNIYKTNPRSKEKLGLMRSSDVMNVL